MAVDRGGLEYTIEVKNEFSTGLRSFRQEVDASRKSWGALKRQLSGTRALSGNAASQFSSLASSMRAMRIEQDRLEARARQQVRSLGRQEGAQTRLLRSSSSLVRNQIRLVRVLQAELTAVNQLTVAYTRLNTARQVRAPSTRLTNGPLPSADQINRVGKAAKSAEASGSRMFFTFRRLVGVLAAFTAARLAAQGVRDLVAEMVEFNQVIETANLGIASLITASGGVRNSLGVTVDASQRLAIAQKEAARQTQLLRRDGLKTAATFQQLVDTFQIAIGPGLAAGLDLDQIRRFTVQVSQAAAAAGVAQNQLSEEIRSILSGTIQQRTTRLAAVLGITNEDIRRAKEAGVLIDFLNEKFQAFTDAGEVALGTFAALSSNAADALGQLLGAGGEQFFESLKGLLNDVKNALTDIEPLTGTLSPDPEALKIVEGLAQGLSRIVEEGRRLGGALGFSSLGDTASLIGDGIGFAAEALGAIIEGFLKGANDLAGVVQSIVSLISSVSGSTLIADGTVAAFVRLGTVVAGLLVSFKAIAAVAATLQTAVTVISGKALLTAAAYVAVAAGVGFAANAAKDFAGYSSGAETSWGQVLAYAENLGRYAIAQLVEFFTVSFGEIRYYANVTATSLRELFNQLLLGFQQQVYAAIGVFSDEYKKRADEVLKQRDKDLERTKEIIEEEKLRLRLLEDQARAASRQAEIRYNKTLQQIEQDPDAFSLGSTANRAAEGIADSLKGLFSSLEGSLGGALGSLGDQVIEQQDRLNSLIESIAPVIDKNRETLEEQSDLTERIADNYAKARVELEKQQATQGLSGGVEEQVSLGFKTQIEQRKALAKLLREEAVERRGLIELQQREGTLKEQIGKLSRLQQRDVEVGVQGVKRVIASETQRAELLNKIRILELQIQKGKEEGQDTAVLERSLTRTQEFFDLFSRRVANIKGQVDAILEAPGAQDVADAIKQQIELDGQRTVAEQRILEILREQAVVRRSFQDQEALGISQVAQRETVQVEQSNEQERVKAAAQGDQLREAVYLGNLEIKQLQDKQRLEEERLGLLIEQQTAREATLQAELQQAVDQAEFASIQESILVTEQSITDLLAQQAALRERNALSAASLQQAQEQREARALRQNNLNGNNGFEAEFGQRFADANEALPSAAKFAFQQVETAALATADTISGAIIDAFDPEKKVNLKERFAQLGRTIVNTLIQELVRLAIAKSILAIGNGLFGAASAGGGGANSGGVIGPDGAQGFSDGTSRVGRPNMPTPRPPRGLHPKDNVPAWLSVGESVIRTASSLKAGYDAMGLINEGRFDPTLLRAALGLSSRRSTAGRRRASGMGYASGGTVTPVNGSELRLASPAAAGAQVAIVMPSEATADRLLAAGPQSFQRAARQSKSALKSILR